MLLVFNTVLSIYEINDIYYITHTPHIYSRITMYLNTVLIPTHIYRYHNK